MFFPGKHGGGHMDSGNFSRLNNSRNGTNDRIMVEISFINWEWHGDFSREIMGLC